MLGNAYIWLARAAIGWWPRSFYTLILSILSIPLVTFVKFIRDGTTIHRNILNSSRFIAETRHGTRRGSFMLDDGSFSRFSWFYWCWLYSYLVYAVNNRTYVTTMKNFPYLKLLQPREKNHLYSESKNLSILSYFQAQDFHWRYFQNFMSARQLELEISCQLYQRMRFQGKHVWRSAFLHCSLMG